MGDSYSSTSAVKQTMNLTGMLLLNNWSLTLSWRRPLSYRVESLEMHMWSRLLSVGQKSNTHKTFWTSYLHSKHILYLEGPPTLSMNSFVFLFAETVVHNPSKLIPLQVINRNTRERCKIYLKLTMKTPERLYWLRSGVLILDSEHISHLFWYFCCWFWTGKCLLGLFYR